MIDSSGNKVHLVSAWVHNETGLWLWPPGRSHQYRLPKPRRRVVRGPQLSTTAVLQKELLHRGERLLRTSSRSEGTDLNHCCFLRVLEERKLS